MATESKRDLITLVLALAAIKKAGQGGGEGVTRHSQLSGRNAGDQHPISAITGLEDALSVTYDSDTGNLQIGGTTNA